MHHHLHDARLLQRGRIKQRPRRRAALLLASLLVSHGGVIAAPLPAAAEESARVIIQEVAWAGSGLSASDEWIELANIGDATATIGGWSLAGAGQSGRDIFFPEDAFIPPQGTFIVANYKAEDANSALSVPIGLATTTMSLSNSAFGVILNDANGNLVDAAGDGALPPAGTSDPRASMIRIATSTEADAWMTAATSTGFKDGITDAGTPGYCDFCDPRLATSMDTPPPEEAATSTETLPDEERAAISAGMTIFPENTSSTEAVLQGSETTASTSGTATFSSATTSPSTTTQPSSSPASSPTSNVPLPASSTPTQSPAPPIQLGLNETVSNPLAGPEWVELSLATDIQKTDRPLELWDAAGRIAAIPKETPVTIPGFLIVTLKSARLNNAGDEISLRETNGTILERTAIPKLNKGESWAKDDRGRWRVTPLLTPAMENMFLDEPEEEAGDEHAQTITAPAEASAPDITTSNATALQASSNVPLGGMEGESLLAPSSLSASLDAVLQAALLANEQAFAPKSPSAKPASAAKGEIINTYPFESMFDSDLNGARVRVTGIVGSVAKLLGASSHTFILENEDGRGLIVYLPPHLNVPAYGSVVSVAGTLNATYRGPELRMKKTDVWMTLADEGTVVPRIVDLLAPGAEDAWSLVSVEGTVRDIKSASFVLGTDEGIDVTIGIPAAAGYRIARLTKQDRIRVTGLLDIRKDHPTIIPRRPEDIELTQHAPESVAAPIEPKPQSRFPDWAPFGAAAGAIAVTGFSKRFREFLKRKKLQMLVEKARTASL